MKRAVGCIGLGKMGSNLVLHLLEQAVPVVVYNRTAAVVDEFLRDVASGIAPGTTIGQVKGTMTLADFVHALPAPRVVFMMVTAGKAVDDVIAQLLEAGLTAGDIIIDAGNCHYKDTQRRAAMLKEKSITLIDCGTSGGLEGARYGACLMLGGPEAVIQELSWLWDAAAVAGGWCRFGDHGAGHFVKMVHNGVEYGMNQALGEGFAILAQSPFQLDLARVADNWNHGSVVRGWLVELLGRAFKKDGTLSGYTGKIGGGETGRWTQATAAELGVPVPILDQAMAARERSQTTPDFASKVVSALRFQYGGHKEPLPQENTGKK